MLLNLNSIWTQNKCCTVYYAYTNIHGNGIMTTSITNEYTSLRKYKSHTLFSKGWCFAVCERWVETGKNCYLDPSSPLDHRSISFSPWLGCSTVGPEGSALSLQTGSHAGIPVSDWLTATGTLSIFFLNAHLPPLFFGLFTQVHLLIDGSVEGQYIVALYGWPEQTIPLSVSARNQTKDFCTWNLAVSGSGKGTRKRVDDGTRTRAVGDWTAESWRGTTERCGRLRRQ